MQLNRHHLFEFGLFQLDSQERLLYRNGEAVALPPKTLDLLVVLVENSGHLLEKDELMKRLWPDSFVEEANLSHHVFALRKALGDGENGAVYIETVPRRGYRFVPFVSEIGDEASSAHGASLPLADRESTSKPGGLTGRLTLLATVVILTAIISWIVIRTLWQGSAGVPPAIESLAVLPLRNLSADPEQVYFVDGMTDALISHLGKIHGLSVISRTSTMQYIATRKSLREIAQELGVQALLEGSILRSGGRVRITLRLVEAATDRQRWAESYDGELGDVLALQTRVAADVAREIRTTVTEQTGVRIAEGQSVDPAAYDDYLKGHYYLRKRTSDGFQKALKYFEQAIAKDPDYAASYAGLADVYDMLAGYTLLAPREAFPKARAAAMRALQIDDRLAEAHTALAKVKARYDWDWQGAEKEFVRAIELNPGYAPGHHWYAFFYLAATGQVDKAIAEMEQARRLDPLSLNINTELALILSYAGRHERAMERLQSSLEIDPDFTWTHTVLGRVYFQRGMFQAAIGELEKAVELSPDYLYSLGPLGRAYGVSGREPDARKILETLVERSRKQYVPSDSFAEVHTGLGDKRRALEYLEKAYEERSRKLNWIKVDSTWDTLRVEPEFQDLLRRVIPEPR